MTVTLVCMADTHTFEADLGEIPEGDILVHAGDFCRRGDVEEVERARAFLAGLPHPHKVVVAGNHDWLFQKEPDLARSIFAGFTYLELHHLGVRATAHRHRAHPRAMNARSGRAHDLLHLTRRGLTRGPPCASFPRSFFHPEAAQDGDVAARF